MTWWSVRQREYRVRHHIQGCWWHICVTRQSAGLLCNPHIGFQLCFWLKWTECRTGWTLRRLLWSSVCCFSLVILACSGSSTSLSLCCKGQLEMTTHCRLIWPEQNVDVHASKDLLQSLRTGNWKLGLLIAVLMWLVLDEDSACLCRIFCFTLHTSLSLFWLNLLTAELLHHCTI